MKNSLIAVLFATAVVFMIASGWWKAEDSVAAPLHIPNSGAIDSITVTAADGTQYSYSDEEWITQLYAVLSDARTTDKATVQDGPSAEYYGKIDIVSSENITTVFYYEEDGKQYIEQPYQGIYETDVCIEDFVK